jgi:hypothetical protein
MPMPLSRGDCLCWVLLLERDRGRARSFLESQQRICCNQRHLLSFAVLRVRFVQRQVLIHKSHLGRLASTFFFVLFPTSTFVFVLFPTLPDSIELAALLGCNQTHPTGRILHLRSPLHASSPSFLWHVFKFRQITFILHSFWRRQQPNGFLPHATPPPRRHQPSVPAASPLTYPRLLRRHERGRHQPAPGPPLFHNPFTVLSRQSPSPFCAAPTVSCRSKQQRPAASAAALLLAAAGASHDQTATC